MLELSMTLPIKVQNGGLFISRGVGRHPARRLESWEIIFVEKGRLTIQEEERIFLVDAGESLLLWPNRQHVGVEDFPADLKFYWLHFEVKAPDNDPRWLTHLSVPQQTKVVDPQALVALFRQFLSEQEKHQRTPALEFIVLLILQQLTRDARLDEQADGAHHPCLESAETDPHAISSPAFYGASGPRAVLQCRLSWARLPAGVSSDVNRSNPSPAGARSRKAVN